MTKKEVLLKYAPRSVQPDHVWLQCSRREVLYLSCQPILLLSWYRKRHSYTSILALTSPLAINSFRSSSSSTRSGLPSFLPHVIMTPRFWPISCREDLGPSSLYVEVIIATVFAAGSSHLRAFLPSSRTQKHILTLSSAAKQNLHSRQEKNLASFFFLSLYLRSCRPGQISES